MGSSNENEKWKTIRWIIIGGLVLGAIGLIALSGITFPDGSGIFGLLGLGTGTGFLGLASKRSRGSSGGSNNRDASSRLDELSNELQGIRGNLDSVLERVRAMEERVADSISRSGDTADNIRRNFRSGQYTIRDSDGNIINSSDTSSGESSTPLED